MPVIVDHPSQLYNDLTRLRELHRDRCTRPFYINNILFLKFYFYILQQNNLNTCKKSNLKKINFF
jgi:hypothetical protein